MTKQSQRTIKVLLVVGARPNFVKIMPLIREIEKYPRRIKPYFVHTGQHYDFEMSVRFFEGLDIPEPDVYLGVGSDTHGAQTAKVIQGVEKILLKDKFNLVIVTGDVNSTLAAALAAVKLNVKVAHVEAGLRSFDRTMPEEINRILTDHISDYLFTTEGAGNKNLLNEGIQPSKMFLVGNIMIDSCLICKDKISNSKIIERLNLKKDNFCLVTIHRPSNVDRKQDLKRTVDILEAVNRKIRVVFPAHPRTEKLLKKYNLKLTNAILSKPLDYIDFHKLMMNAKLVITDSGGVQEETTFLQVPCLTIRDTTERPITITKGTNELIALDKTKMLKAVNKIMRNEWKKGLIPSRWDGKTAQRIVRILLKEEKCICT